MYKRKIISFVEYRTPAVYHEASTLLAGIDAIKKRFFRECSLTEEDALLFFNLAPLATRGDIAMLGLIHRFVLGCGSRHFASMFQLAPPSTSQKDCWHLQSHRGSRHLQKQVRSTPGLTDVYNLLPARVVPFLLTQWRSMWWLIQPQVLLGKLVYVKKGPVRSLPR